VSRFEQADHSQPENLTLLNTEYDEWDPFISPDESYLIFCSTKPGGPGMDDLYISFRADTGDLLRCSARGAGPDLVDGRGHSRLRADEG
jgi:hypothetical protein